MDNREEFENWAIENGYDVSHDTSKRYIYTLTKILQDGWQARQTEIDALKAEITELKKMVEDNHNPGNIHE